MKPGPRRWPPAALSTLAALSAVAALAQGMGGAPAPRQERGREIDLQEQRGRQIYRTGASPSGGEMTAVLAEGAVEVPASAMPCASCHGRDGRGRPEGGVSPSDLRWNVLSRPYGATRPSGRSHPSYDERLLKRAIALGIDPAGNELHAAMPRYRMSLADMDDLLAYLKRLGDEPVPGVGESAVRIGTLLPEGSAGDFVRALLGGYFAEVNRRGGVYGRKIELVAEAPAGSPSERHARVAAWLDREPLFALVGASLAGAEGELAALFLERELPVVGTIGPRSPGTSSGRRSGPSQSPPPAPPAAGRPGDQPSVPSQGAPAGRPAGPSPAPSPGAANPYVFYLLPGLDTLGRALLAFAREEPPGKLAVMAGPDPSFTTLAAEMEAAAGARGWTVAKSLGYAPGGPDAAQVRELRETRAETVFFAGPGADLARLLGAAAEMGWHPRVLSPGPLAGADLFAAPRGFDRRLFLAFPTLPTDQTPAALAEYQSLAPELNLPRRPTPAQVAALASAKLLVEALNRAGRELTREALLERLEALDRFETGLLPTLGYAPGRRIGAPGAYVVTLDLIRQTFVPVSGWIEGS